MFEYIVYMHENKVNQKKYIGITSQNINRRWQNGYGYRNQKHFFRAIEKYGWDMFNHYILFTNLTKEEAEQKEVELISKYKATDKNYGYNIDNGGNSVGKLSEETKNKIKKAKCGICSPFKNKHHSEEALEKIRKAAIGRHHTNETKIKIRNANKNRIYYGVKVIQYDLNGNFIKEYNSISDAYRKTNVSISGISKVCKGQRKTAGGFVWKLGSGFL